LDKFQNKYRNGSARAHWWDYGWNGAYFITICTRNRGHYFGEIYDGKMELSHLGIIANVLWHEIPNHSVSVELGDFVIMPNHIHGILIIDKPNVVVETGHIVGSEHALNLRAQSPQPHGTQSLQPGDTRFQNIGKNTISSIIGSYKSAVTKHANRLKLKNGWQNLFHDRIIRNDEEYQRISNYIINNPINWEKDKLNLL